MRARDLMIGDWVLMNSGPAKVTKTYEDSIIFEDKFGVGLSQDSFGMPLSEEILENNFPKRDSEADYVKERMESGFSVNWFPISDLDGVFFLILDMPYKLDSARIEHIHKGTFKYVHEVQHLLRLCGIDKEITL